jgi:hypothetical protein
MIPDREFVSESEPFVSVFLTASSNSFFEFLGPDSAIVLIAESMDPPDWRMDVIIPITDGDSFRSLLLSIRPDLPDSDGHGAD